MANKKKQPTKATSAKPITKSLPILWEVVRLQGHQTPVVNHSKGVIRLIEETVTSWNSEGGTLNAELTFDVPNSITETPSVIRLGDELWDVHNVSVPQSVGNKEYTHYQLGVLVFRRDEQFVVGSGDAPHFLGTFDVDPKNDLHFLGTDVSSTPDSSGGYNLDGLSQLVDDRHKNAFSAAASKAAEAMQQFAASLAGPSQALNQIGQQMLSGFGEGFENKMKQLRKEAEDRLADVRATHERAAEIDLEITSQYLSVQNRQEKYGYFVVTGDYKVVSFESKEHLNCFLVEQLDNQAYGIVLAHSFAEWFGSSANARLYDIIKAIENYERNQEAQNANRK